MKVICAAKTASGAKQDGQATYAPAEEITNSIIKGTFAWSSIKSNLTTTSYYYTEKIADDDATKRFKY